MSQSDSYTYAKAGVSIAAGNALVKAIAPLAKSTARPGADASLGGFGGFFDLKAAGFKDPLLVAEHVAGLDLFIDMRVADEAAVERARALLESAVAASKERQARALSPATAPMSASEDVDVG